MVRKKETSMSGDISVHSIRKSVSDSSQALKAQIKLNENEPSGNIPVKCTIRFFTYIKIVSI